MSSVARLRSVSIAGRKALISSRDSTASSRLTRANVQFADTSISLTCHIAGLFFILAFDCLFVSMFVSSSAELIQPNMS